MSDVRFLILAGPPSLDPATAGFPPSEPPRGADPSAEVSLSGNQSSPANVTRPVVKRRPGVAGTSTEGWWYAWRLMASNNRRLANGVASFTSRSRVVDAIVRMTENLADLLPQIMTDPENGSWGWRAELSGVPVALCPHRYERERDCRAGFNRFVETIPKAQIAPGGMVLHDRHDRVAPVVNIEESRRWLAR